MPRLPTLATTAIALAFTSPATAQDGWFVATEPTAEEGISQHTFELPSREREGRYFEGWIRISYLEGGVTTVVKTRDVTPCVPVGAGHEIWLSWDDAGPSPYPCSPVDERSAEVGLTNGLVSRMRQSSDLQVVHPASTSPVMTFDVRGLAGAMDRVGATW